MRKSFVLVLLFSSCGPRKEESAMKDPLIDRLAADLPRGWNLISGPDRLTIERKEKAWVLFENRINAPVSRETSAERSARIRKHGKESACRLVFRIEPRWTRERVLKARQANTEIEETIASLSRKHDIAHLRDDRLSRKGEDVYTPKTPEEEKRVEAYRKELRELRARQTEVPRLHSERHSLFFESAEGREDEYAIVDPPEASQESFEISRKMQQILKEE